VEGGRAAEAFLADAVFSSAALPASALRWLTCPRAETPVSSGPRRIGQADIDGIRDLAQSYREMDNLLGGGRLRSGRAFNLPLLASARAMLGEPEQACAVGRQALNLTGRLTSARSVRYVRGVARQLRSPASSSTTAIAQRRIRKTYCVNCT
jgi:hypothetical protein